MFETCSVSPFVMPALKRAAPYLAIALHGSRSQHRTLYLADFNVVDVAHKPPEAAYALSVAAVS
jgi:hypothetical protein